MQIPKFSYSQFQQKQLQLGALPSMIYQAHKLKVQPLFEPRPLNAQFRTQTIWLPLSPVSCTTFHVKIHLQVENVK